MPFLVSFLFSFLQNKFVFVEFDFVRRFFALVDTTKSLNQIMFVRPRVKWQVRILDLLGFL